MVYACGPEPMLKAVAQLATRYHQHSQVSVERVMGCGLGGCYSCVVPVKRRDDLSAGAPRANEEHANLVRSCISGPVFDGAELVWD
jgi:dihydroorotate dehydrogenase electron transfer subunit